MEYRIHEAARVFVDHRDLQLLAAAEMREHAAFGHRQRIGQRAYGQSLQPGAAGHPHRRIEDAFTGLGAFAQAGGGHGVGAICVKMLKSERSCYFELECFPGQVKLMLRRNIKVVYRIFSLKKQPVKRTRQKLENVLYLPGLNSRSTRHTSWGSAFLMETTCTSMQLRASLSPCSWL